MYVATPKNSGQLYTVNYKLWLTELFYTFAEKLNHGRDQHQ